MLRATAHMNALVSRRSALLPASTFCGVVASFLEAFLSDRCSVHVRYRLSSTNQSLINARSRCTVTQVDGSIRRCACCFEMRLLSKFGSRELSQEAI